MLHSPIEISKIHQPNFEKLELKCSSTQNFYVTNTTKIHRFYIYIHIWRTVRRILFTSMHFHELSELLLQCIRSNWTIPIVDESNLISIKGRFNPLQIRLSCWNDFLRLKSTYLKEIKRNFQKVYDRYVPKYVVCTYLLARLKGNE